MKRPGKDKKMKKTRVAIIGIGSVGATIAEQIMLTSAADEIILIDMKQDKAEAEALDLIHAASFNRKPCRIESGDYSQCKNADIVIITAAAPLIQGQTRLDMLGSAKRIVGSIIPAVMQSGFDGFMILITNPVDIMSYYAWKLSGLPAGHVMGTGNALDSARLKTILSGIYEVNPSSIQAYTLGEHGDSQFIPWSTVSIYGKPIDDIIQDNPEKSAGLDKETVLADVKDAGWKIARVKNTTNYGIASTCLQLVNAILCDEDTIMPVSTYLSGQYGIDDVYLSVPAVINSQGVADLLNLHLSEDEAEKLRRSAEVLRAMNAKL